VLVLVTVLVGVFVLVMVLVGVLVGVFVGVWVFVGVVVWVGVGVWVGHTILPFKYVLHSSQSSKIWYELKLKDIFGTPLAITVQALNPPSVVNKNVFCGLLIKIFKRC
jgi:hypothetical protein